VLDHRAVSAVIPGFKNVRQVEQNLTAAQAPPFSSDELERLARFFDDHVRAQVRGEM
jgi:aryl-alcohol dehydrogenase-like predicted oxidoreductase